MIQKGSQMTALSAAADIVENLGERVAATRAERKVSLRTAGEQAGLTHTIIDRLEKGGTPNAETVAKLLRWLDAQ